MTDQEFFERLLAEIPDDHPLAEGLRQRITQLFEPSDLEPDPDEVRIRTIASLRTLVGVLPRLLFLPDPLNFVACPTGRLVYNISTGSRNALWVTANPNGVLSYTRIKGTDHWTVWVPSGGDLSELAAACKGIKDG